MPLDTVAINGCGVGLMIKILGVQLPAVMLICDPVTGKKALWLEAKVPSNVILPLGL